MLKKVCNCKDKRHSSWTMPLSCLICNGADRPTYYCRRCIGYVIFTGSSFVLLDNWFSPAIINCFISLASGWIAVDRDTNYACRHTGTAEVNNCTFGGCKWVLCLVKCRRFKISSRQQQRRLGRFITRVRLSTGRQVQQTRLENKKLTPNELMQISCVWVWY